MSRISAPRNFPLQGPLGSSVTSGYLSQANGGAGTVAGKSYAPPAPTPAAAPAPVADTSHYQDPEMIAQRYRNFYGGQYRGGPKMMNTL